MQMKDNKYFYDVMSKYFIILIEMNLFQYRQNKIRIGSHDDDKALGIYEAMKEIAEYNNVICVNFPPDFPIQKTDNLHFIDTSNMYISITPCDFIFVYGIIEYETLRKICNYYNPNFIFY